MNAVGWNRAAPGVRLVATLVAVVAVTIGALDRTALAEDQAEGKRRFVRGQELYTEGKFLEAAKEFEVGYAAAPRTAFLLNIGHCYRRAGQLERAKSYYEKLLQTDPGFDQRHEVEEHIRNIDDVLSIPRVAAPKRDPQPGASPTRPAPMADPAMAFRRPVPDEPETLPAAAPTVDAEGQKAQGQEDDGSIFSSPWFWAILIALAAGGGIAAATLTSSEADCPGTVCFKDRLEGR